MLVSTWLPESGVSCLAGTSDARTHDVAVRYSERIQLQTQIKVTVALLVLLAFASGTFAQAKTLVWSLSDRDHCDIWTEPETGQKLLRISNGGILVAHELWSADKKGVAIVFYITNNSMETVRFRFSDFGGVVSSPGFETLTPSPPTAYAKILKPEAMQEQEAYLANPSQPVDLGPKASDFIWVLFDRPKTRPDNFRELRFRLTIDDTEYIFPDHFGSTETSPLQTAPPEPKAQSTTSPCASSSPESVSASAETMVVSFAIADQSGSVHPGMPGWASNWVRKNAKKYPNVLFQQGCPVQGKDNYLIVFSSSASALSGFDPVVTTNSTTDTTPVSGSGTVTDNYGSTWNYTYNGEVTTTTTTTTEENVPYTIQSNTLYATAYDARGIIVSQRWHVYNTKQGGDPGNSIGYNLGSALGAINSRGRLLNAVVKDIAGKKRK